MQVEFDGVGLVVFAKISAKSIARCLETFVVG